MQETLLDSLDSNWEARSSKRLHIHVAAELQVKGKRLVLQTKDVAPTGAFLVTDQVFEDEASIDVGLILPPRFHRVTVRATVAHSISGATARRRGTPAGMGVQFMRDNSPGWSAWTRFIDWAADDQRLHRVKKPAAGHHGTSRGMPKKPIKKQRAANATSPRVPRQSRLNGERVARKLVNQRVSPQTTYYLSPKTVMALRKLLGAVVSGKGFLLKGGVQRLETGTTRLVIVHPVTGAHNELIAISSPEEQVATRVTPVHLSELERQALYWFVESGLSHIQRPPSGGSSMPPPLRRDHSGNGGIRQC